MDEDLNLLDSADLDLEDTINDLCPHESSLANLSLLQVLLRQRLLECTHQTAILRSDLQSACQNRCDGPGASIDCIGSIQEGIGALMTTLSTIRSSSTEAQSVVESITKEIRTLDLAKANIESAVAGLKRLGMLVHAFDQLTRLAKSRKYRETASALQAVQSLTVHLDQLAHNIPRVATLFKALQDTQDLLRRTIMEEFSTAFEEKTVAANKGQLADSCLVIEALGDDARYALIEWYTNFQLREYRRIFSGPSSEAGQLDNISRRYAWFRRILKSHEEDSTGGAKVFPESWHVGASLCGQFGDVTREDLKIVLSRCHSTLKVDMLLQALQTTTGFEKEMAQKFGMPYENIAAKSKPANMGSAAPIRTAFEPYLGMFVDAQDSALSDMFNTFRSSIPKLSSYVDIRLDDRPAAILPSSMELFHFYRTTLDRCASLTNRKPFLDLCEVYKKWLKVYSEEILAATLSGAIVANASALVGGATEGPTLEASGSSGDGYRLVRIPFLLCACAVLNTADYCAGTSEQLQNKLKEEICPDLKSKVTLEAEQELFRGNISSAISSLLKEFEDSCDNAFSAMVKLPWKDMEFVSAESGYVHDVINVVTVVTDLIKQHTEQKKYVRNFCDKVVSILATRFSRSIVRCRPIPSIAAEQMILDLQVIKNHLQLLPQLSTETSVPSSYTRYVTKSIGKLDTLLKVIMTPDEPAEEFVKHYLLLIPCQSFSDFQKVLDLKGGKPQEQNALLDVFLAMTSVQSDLPDSSFLSAIDMNPDAPANSVQLLPFPRLVGRDMNPSTGSNDNARKLSANSSNNNYSNLDSDVSSAASSRAFTDFRRFGQKLGMGLRFTRDTKAE